MIKQIASTTYNANAANHVGRKGYLFFDPDAPEMRCSDGSTPGGIPMTGAVSQVRFPLSSAQLLACNNPIQILPAPGAGKIIVIHSSIYCLNFGTTAYNGDGSGLWYGQSISADGTGFGVFNGSDSQVQQSLSWTVYNQQPLASLCFNCPINLWSPNSTLTGGDGTGSITVYYSVVTL